MRINIETCKFEPGQIVHHKKYGYRGVIYDVDNCFQADEEWYLKNRTQPNRNQPWYHILVDGAEHATYVAQENLERDETPAPVEHPMVDDFFNLYQAGKYHRQFDA